MNGLFNYRVVCWMSFLGKYESSTSKYFDDYFKALKYAAGRCVIHGHAFVCDRQGKVLNIFSGQDAIITIE